MVANGAGCKETKPNAEVDPIKSFKTQRMSGDDDRKYELDLRAAFV
jgi:hypothetical protein